MWGWGLRPAPWSCLQPQPEGFWGLILSSAPLGRAVPRCPFLSRRQVGAVLQEVLARLFGSDVTNQKLFFNFAALRSSACNSSLLGRDFGGGAVCRWHAHICGASWVCARELLRSCFTPASGAGPSQGKKTLP